MGRLTKQGQWAVSVEVLQGLPELGLQMDTAICNAGLAACMRGCVWSKAKAILDLMIISGIIIDNITYSTLLSVPRRRRLWPAIIEVGCMHLSAIGVHEHRPCSPPEKEDCVYRYSYPFTLFCTMCVAIQVFWRCMSTYYLLGCIRMYSYLLPTRRKESQHHSSSIYVLRTFDAGTDRLHARHPH
jgi:hypothetical protein